MIAGYLITGIWLITAVLYVAITAGMYSRTSLHRANELYRRNLKMEWDTKPVGKEYESLKTEWIRRFRTSTDTMGSFRLWLLLVNGFSVALSLNLRTTENAIHAVLIFMAYILFATYHLLVLNSGSYNYSIARALIKDASGNPSHYRVQTAVRASPYFPNAEWYVIVSYLVTQIGVAST